MALIFFGAQFAGGLLLDYVWPEVRFPAAYDKLKQFEGLPRSPDVICLGSSRFQGFINDAELTRELQQRTGRADLRAFNGSIEGGDLIAQEFMLRQTLARGARPRVLVLELSPETLNAFNEFYRLHVLRQFRWEDLPRHASGIAGVVSPGQILSCRFVPLFQHRHQLVKRAWTARPPLAEPTARAMSEAEYAAHLVPRESPNAQLQRQALEGLPHPLFMHRYSLGGRVTEALERILVLCAGHGITPVLIGAPVSSAYRPAYRPAVQAPYEEFIGRICNTYGVRYFEYRAAVPDHLFADTHHTTQDGGLVFSRLLAREVLAGYWGPGGGPRE